MKRRALLGAAPLWLAPAGFAHDQADRYTALVTTDGGKA